MAHCHGHGHDSVHDQHDESELAECPVMPGSTVVKAEAEEDGLYRDYNGRRYYFCCDSCGPLWDADPERYAAA
ncbi:YHS domain-containing protein [Phytoactinopolyspora halotolerans]|uniref:YHS domain-containing protein n=1 Tax=Phytoactinopolyspora halotolerans TaxID=1981512 RepID=A0A6L9SBQ0_9ACTN|nr:YHS domain-containing protein [Phytoactinopolyspora halotolerans]NEE01971.1 YHS domain-containing protein [Phytoactinopolyspora halotolerans]